MKKVVFIEDEPGLQKSLSMALKAQEIDVHSAFDGETGFNLIGEVKPDLVLLDLILPKMDGFTVLEKMKESEELNKIPVIILTNLEDTDDIQRVVGLGATNYLIKANYNVQDISSKVKEILGM